MKYLPLLLLLCSCLSPRTDTPAPGPALSRRVVCAEVETVYYDAFLGGCRPGDCRYCLDTTKFYQRLHECDPAETLRSHYKELE
jgi:hypothetical protein